MELAVETLHPVRLIRASPDLKKKKWLVSHSRNYPETVEGLPRTPVTRRLMLYWWFLQFLRVERNGISLK